MSTKELLQENRSRGWSSVSDFAPAWVRSQIIAFRAAALDGREYRMSTRQIQEAEQRSLASKAVNAVKNVFRPSVQDENTPAAIAKRNGITVDAYLNAQLRLKLKEQGDRIRRDELVQNIHDAAGAL